MPIRLDNRVAIVTGAGGGLGRAHALTLAKLGAKVVVNDPGGAVDGRGSDQTAADKVVSEIRAAGGEAVASYDSVASFESAKKIVATAVDSFGTLDILVHNAGILRDKTLARMEMGDFHDVLQVHLMGGVYCTKAAWPIMTGKKYGRIVMTTSGSGIGGNFGQSNYAAAKLAVVGFHNALKLESSRSNIRINSISPTALTRMTDRTGQAQIEFLKFCKPELVSPAVAWLCSEECDISGQIVGAGAGFFCSVHYYHTRGVLLDPTREVTVDDFAAVRDQVFDFSDPVKYDAMGRYSKQLLVERGYLKS
jgi:NAD(P)-dependent dehydrogenase (short-subunit alcohol dehydrogenase family)